MSEAILELKGIRKCFASTVALDDVTLRVYPGEVRGLIGENGSGKSTISSIAAGMQKADKGEMLFRGQPWAPVSMIDALTKGVGMIVQESGAIPGITVAENLFLGEVGRFKGKLGTVDLRTMNARADQALEDIGVTGVRGSMLVGELDFQTRKLVEIAKVAMKEPAVLVVDETTTALSLDGRRILYELIARYRDEGRAVLFISHDLDEIMDVCDTLTVLRDGKLIRHFTRAEFDADAIRTSMIGRELEGDYYRSDTEPSRWEETAVEVSRVSLGTQLQDVSFAVHKGEIVGIGGLSHCGMHTLGKVLFGALRPEQGEVCVSGARVTSEAVAMKLGLGYLSKDRDVESLSLTASIKDNIAIAGMERYAMKGFLMLSRREKAYVDAQIQGLSIKCADREQPIGQLSGGNKQKAVFGKWIGRGSDILILDCPTRGVDIGVKRAMYQLMMRLKDEGKTIIMISEELPELMGMSDRLLIMKDGRITREFTRGVDFSDGEIIKYMI